MSGGSRDTDKKQNGGVHTSFFGFRTRSSYDSKILSLFVYYEDYFYTKITNDIKYNLHMMFRLERSLWIFKKSLHFYRYRYP
jgi:hypothetical protein